MGKLDKTVAKMVSADYKERFMAEYEQVSIRLASLSEIIRKFHNSTLEFELKCPIAVLETQAVHMANYKAILKYRAELEGIDLER